MAARNPRTVINNIDGKCTCNCGEKVTRKFKQGHDQRLRGQLLAAHRAGTNVQIVDREGRRTVTAMQAAATLDTPRASWTGYLTEATK